jgi:DNA polymerase elongation subunit (family B)
MVSFPFYVYKLRYEDIDEKLNIRLWAVTRDKKSISINVKNYSFYIYLELSDTRWNENKARNLHNDIKKGLAKAGHAPTDWKFDIKYKLYGAPEVCPDNIVYVLELYFDSLEAAKHCRNYVNAQIRKGDKRVVNVFEWDCKDIDPVKKMMVKNDLTYCDWWEGELEETEEEYRKTIDGIQEYDVDWKALKKISQEKCADWLPNFKIMGFDIETESEDPNSFPDKRRPNDTVYLISCIFQEIGNPESRKRYAITCLDHNAIPEDFCTMIHVKIEIDGFKEMAKLVREHKPNIITGHNITGYDWDYIDHRIKIDGNGKKGKLKEKCKWPEMGFLEGIVRDMKINRWTSSGAGDIKLIYPDLDGIVMQDTYTYFLRNFKSSSYSLSAMADKFLKGEGKHDLPPREQQRIVREWRKWVEDKKEKENKDNMDIEEGTGSKKRKEIEPAKRKEIQERNFRRKIKNIKIQRGLLTGEVEDYEDEGDPTEEYVLAENTRLIRYCVQDAELTVRMFDEIKIHINTAAMANVACIPWDDVLTGGETKKCKSMFYTFAHRERFIMTPRGKGENTEYEGALVQDPVTGLWDVVVLDFSSMYPSNIMATNICLTTLIPKDIEVEARRIHIIIDQNNKPTGTRFLRQPDNDHLESEKDENDVSIFREGIIPKCERILLEKRGFYKKWCEKFETSPGQFSPPPELKNQFDVYWAMQEKIKVIANSFYGFLGARTNEYSLFEGAAAVTATGRRLITITNEHVINNYNGRVIYGDTDSVMFRIEVNHPKEYHDIGRKLASELNGIFPKVLNIAEGRVKIAYEKSMRIGILKKKYYIAALFDNEGIPNLKKIMSKGVMSSRRDYCGWAQRLFSKVSHDILSMNGFKSSIKLVLDEVENLANNKVDPKLLTIIKRVTSKANDDYWVKRIANREISSGKQINNGDRIEFLIAKSENKKATTAERAVLLEDYTVDTQLDLNYYLEKQLMKQMDDLLTKIYEDEFKIFNYISYKMATRRRKEVRFNEPIKMLSRMVEDKLAGMEIDIQEVLTAIDNITPFIVEAPKITKKIKQEINVVE